MALTSHEPKLIRVKDSYDNNNWYTIKCKKKNQEQPNF